MLVVLVYEDFFFGRFSFFLFDWDPPARSGLLISRYGIRRRITPCLNELHRFVGILKAPGRRLL